MSAGSVSFDMRYVRAKSFWTGTDDSGTATVSDGFWIAETEVTYELWYAVRDWAENGPGGATGEGQYTFANDGCEGNDGTIADPPTSAKYEPVTTINWRDPMVWCNALTEYYNDQNGTSLGCVYYTDSGHTTPIRSVNDSETITNEIPGSQDDPYVKSDADGFRLPTSDEWELAARYIDDGNSDGDIKDADEYYPGGHVSGDTTSYCYPSDGGTSTVFGSYAWYDVNSASSSHVVATRTANALGLCDMSGNVYEWCFDWHPDWVGSRRVVRGCCWSSSAGPLRVGVEYYSIPYNEDVYIGFRPARTP